MKNDPVTKLYSDLTDKERAALAVNYRSQGNEVEVRRIESTMPMQNFVGLPFEYRKSTDSLYNTQMLYAIEYWRLVSRAQAIMGGASATLHQTDDPAQWQPMIKHFEEAEARLLSLDLAFDDVCATHGLDPDTMRYMAGDRFYQIAHPDLKPVAGYQATLREIFDRVMS